MYKQYEHKDPRIGAQTQGQRILVRDRAPPNCFENLRYDTGALHKHYAATTQGLGLNELGRLRGRRGPGAR